ncbi:hypothetical protein FS837_001823 [Tulasnella sp. UAMH 9824]|nr:hypothetical protein FS837_001823 [Tulasnella sp. UAMH 9824]
MFRTAIRLNFRGRAPIPSARLASTASKPSPQSQNLDVAQQLEKDASRILNVVRRRIEERDKLLREDADAQGSSTAHIQRAKTLKELEPLHQAWTRWTEARNSFSETNTLLDDPDPDIRALATEERASLTEVLSEHVNTVFPSLLVPPSTTKHFSALIELKSGVGGDEAALFVADVLKMYTRLASTRGFRVETVSISQLEGSKGSGGGIKEAIIEVQGEGAYDVFRWESGVHRVQRVPATESQGRVHTSTITVMVLPTSDAPGETETDFKIDEKEVKTEVMRARGAGGQHVNKTESAVRLTHIPTGITVSMQDSRSQHSNRAKAWQILRARLLDRRIQEEQAEKRDNRRSIIKGADRSEKIRTYNFPQNRVTDHRIGLTITNLDSVMEGEELQYVIDELQKDHEESVMAELLNE